jgi:hypothetical protein
LAGGGCGYEFKFDTGAAIGNTTGMNGRPLNERQWKFNPMYYQYLNK